MAVTRRHTLTLLSLFLATILSAAVTGELMDMLTFTKSLLLSLLIFAGTWVTCGLFYRFSGKVLEQ